MLNLNQKQHTSKKDLTGEQPRSEDFKFSPSVSDLKRKTYVPRSLCKYSSSKNRFIFDMASIYSEKLSQGSYISYFPAVIVTKYSVKYNSLTLVQQ